MKNIVNRYFGAGMLKWRRRYARGNAHVQIHGHDIGLLKEKIYCLGPKNIGNLMGINHDCCGAAGHRGPGKFKGRKHAAFDMDMRVNKSGRDVCA